MVTINGKVKSLANWILTQLDSSEVEGLAGLLDKGISVSSVSDNSVNEFLTRAEAACLRASFLVAGDSKIIGNKALNGISREVVAQTTQAQFRKLFLDGPI